MPNRVQLDEPSISVHKFLTRHAVDVSIAQVGSSSLRNANLDMFGQPPPDYIPGKGRGAIGLASGVSRDDSTINADFDKGDYSDAKFDKFTGFSEALFKDSTYEEDDRIADFIYSQVDRKLKSRSKKNEELKLIDKSTKDRSNLIQRQFLELKSSLNKVKLEEWDSIPDIGDYSLRLKQQKKQKLEVPLPEHVMHSTILNNSDHLLNIQAFDQTVTSSILNSYPSSNILTNSNTNDLKINQNINELGKAKGNILSLKLDRAMDNVSGQSVVDPNGYLTSLNSINIRSDSDISDIKKARLLLKSVITTNPYHAPGWIAAARLEELVGKLSVAREILLKGCQTCPRSEDIWLERIRLEKEELVDNVIAQAVKSSPSSIRLWLKASERETNPHRRLSVIRKALEFIPNSIKLWREAIELADSKMEKTLLVRAVECVPQSEEMWLRLASISKYKDAQRILNDARKKLPTNPMIWIAAAKLEESNGSTAMVDIIIKRGIDSLSSKGFIHSRQEWLDLAQLSEKDDHPITCLAIIKNTITMGLEEKSIKSTILEDARKFTEKLYIICARSTYKTASDLFKLKKSVWLAWIDFEEKHGSPSDFQDVIQKSLFHCSNKEILWLRATRYQRDHGDIEAARCTLSKAFTADIKDKEAIILAAAELERDVGEFHRARVLLEKARSHSSTVNIWTHSIQLERQLREYDKAISICIEAIKFHNYIPDLWMIYGQIYCDKGTDFLDQALDIFEKGLLLCPNSVDLWLAATDILIGKKDWKKARTMLDRARLKNPKTPELWLATIRLEESAGNSSITQQIMSKALRECPSSGILYAEAIFLESNIRRSISLLALERCENDPYVISAIARLFWNDKDIPKARKWFNSALKIDDKIGDTWIYYIAFEISLGDEDSQISALQSCINSNPYKGIMWNKVVKRVENWNLKCADKLRTCLLEYYPEYQESLNICDKTKILLNIVN
ncbi:pre-mRNA-plicing factor 6, putative [Cryptosporidium muris RN66]|uniref:Pre-mRNA-plicing factor 6, putative n=1 Tax=Cryptosporidium muris (strain RN66) TaxID=441375 RepID=B6A9Y7_CRYMR|nr:pre-mRNA-plicing factor 6, putative [Cryptosporidium muris RN66]EEA05028.1 pre-mRNA-plicing factor 6, putative [Cryptosporidium muris RN66]|eukprot:XP_002139377.1 pre-mRNA-plicing factor 6 [Cryptosporidium muris RN66]